MIKFWKSAAKGKTGCPVRPPEPKVLINPELMTNLNTELDTECEDNSIVFVKKSKLSLNLHDILLEKEL